MIYKLNSKAQEQDFDFCNINALTLIFKVNVTFQFFYVYKMYFQIHRKHILMAKTQTSVE